MGNDCFSLIRCSYSKSGAKVFVFRKIDNT